MALPVLRRFLLPSFFHFARPTITATKAISTTLTPAPNLSPILPTRPSAAPPPTPQPTTKYVAAAGTRNHSENPSPPLSPPFSLRRSKACV
ncbi:hypothetical protein ACMFMF_000171 [Clarireedia jacksonii]